MGSRLLEPRVSAGTDLERIIPAPSSALTSRVPTCIRRDVMRLLRFLGLEIVGATETRRLTLSTRVSETLLGVTGLVGPFEVRETCVWAQGGGQGITSGFSAVLQWLMSFF